MAVFSVYILAILRLTSRGGDVTPDWSSKQVKFDQFWLGGWGRVGAWPSKIGSAWAGIVSVMPS